VLALCGGRNVFASLHLLAPQGSVESVVAADPEAIFAPGDAPAAQNWQRDPQRPDFAAWRAFDRMTAVRGAGCSWYRAIWSRARGRVSWTAWARCARRWTR